MKHANPTASCSTCHHPFGPHVVFALGEHARDGGVAVCNVMGCQCVSTWSLDDLPTPALPERDALDRLRRFAQSSNSSIDWTAV